MTSNTSIKSFPVNFKGLAHVSCVDEKVTRCIFKNIFTSEETTLNLKVSLEQIKQWYKGRPAYLCFKHLSADLQHLFETGSIDSEFRKTLNSK